MKSTYITSLSIHPSKSYLPNIASKIANITNKGDVINFHGKIGVGKTTLIRHIIHDIAQYKHLIVKSPSFNIVEEYNEIGVAHFDFYRLEKNEKCDFLDINRYESMINLIEWPENTPQLLFKKADIDVYIYYLNDNTREIVIDCHKEDTTC